MKMTNAVGLNKKDALQLENSSMIYEPIMETLTHVCMIDYIREQEKLVWMYAAFLVRK
jgi:hypothetical protein